MLAVADPCNEQEAQRAHAAEQIGVCALLEARFGQIEPNYRVQATANSVRSCLAPAVCRA
jgi:hypothetical protein